MHRMKNLFNLILLVAIFFSRSTAQNINIYLVKENVEALTTNTRFLLTDPLTIDRSINLPGVLELKSLSSIETDYGIDSTAGSLTNLSIYFETAITPTSMFLRLPIRYRIKDFSISMSIPYYYHRAMEYSYGNVSSSGIGDLQFGANYKIRKDNIFTEFTLNAKFPTGNANKQVDGYLIPLGTGSTDFQIGNFFMFEKEKYNIISNISFRLNGSHSRIVEISYPDNNETEIIEYKIANGNTFSLNTAYIYKLRYGFNALAGIGVISNSEGKLSRTHTYSWDRPTSEYLDQSACQNFLYVDMNLGLSYAIFKFDIVLNVRPPIYTIRSESNTEENRSVIFFVRLSRKLF